MATATVRRYCITRGDRFELRITLTQGGVPLDLTAQNFSPRMELRASPGATIVAVELTAVVSGGSNNIVTLTLGAAESLARTAGVVLHGRLLLEHSADEELDQITKTKYEFVVEDSATKR